MCATTCENGMLFVVAGVGVSLASCLCRSRVMVVISFVGGYFCGGRGVCCKGFLIVVEAQWVCPKWVVVVYVGYVWCC